MNQTKINAAAKVYAMDVFGDQAETNKDALKSIMDDFKAGVEWAKANMAQPVETAAENETTEDKTEAQGSRFGGDRFGPTRFVS